MCKKAAALKDLRPIYTRNIVVVDSSERDRALELAERYRLEAAAAKAAEATSRLQATMNLTELQLARAELKTLRRQLELYVRARASGWAPREHRTDPGACDGRGDCAARRAGSTRPRAWQRWRRR